MEDLLSSLDAFIDCLELQCKIYNELPAVLDEEESTLASFSMVDFENVYVAKDRLVQRAQACEERRKNLLKRICYFISFDMRTELPSLSVFLAAYESYLSNVQSLVEVEIFAGLSARHERLSEVAASYLDLFQKVQPRIYRNQEVLRKVTMHFARSAALIESQLNVQQSYNANGKTSSVAAKKASSSLQIRV